MEQNCSKENMEVLITDQKTIQDRAIEVLIANNGASLQEIAQATGIGRTTLHRYFPSRDDLIRSLLSVAYDDAEEVIERSQLDNGPVEAALERLVRAFLPIGHRYQFLLNMWSLSTDPTIREREEELVKKLDVFMARSQREGVLRSDLPVRWLNDSLTALLFTAWLNIRDGFIALQDAPRLVLSTFLNGVAARTQS